jgi:regulator of RNase E activity RraB
MKTLTVNIVDELSEKAIIAVLDALKLGYEIDDDSKFKDETERIMANPYLAEKISQGKTDMVAGKGTKVALEDTWK